MRIAFVSSEYFPYSKTGGLADVSSALPRALAAAGDEVTVFTPRYRQVAERWKRDGERPAALAGPDVTLGDRRFSSAWRRHDVAGVRIHFLDQPELFDREHLYDRQPGEGYDDNLTRFAVLCRATLAHVAGAEPPYDVIHVHDWQTALIPIDISCGARNRLPAPVHGWPPVVLTIHNLAYQGLFPREGLAELELPEALFTPAGLEFYGRINLLKGGILYADAVTTVSRSYAEEILTPEFGCGLDGVLREHREKLHGIVNGVETSAWDPQRDPHLPGHYHRDDLRGKSACRQSLQERMGLDASTSAFLLGSVTRFDHQKGIGLLLDALEAMECVGMEFQLVLVGTGDRELEERARDAAASHPRRVATHIGYDEGLAHLVEGGADAFVMPSLYEPCGLNQIYSQHYGTPPIARATGGLRDTIVDADEAAIREGRASGFLFAEASPAALAVALRRAEMCWRERPEEWRRIVRAGMTRDFSWQRSAAVYRELYLGVKRARSAPAPRVEESSSSLEAAPPEGGEDPVSRS